MSYYLGGGICYYYWEEGFDGAYLGFQFIASRYDYRMKTQTGTAYSFDCSDRYKDFTFQWGYQYCGDRISTDLYFGVGIRALKASRPVFYDDYLNSSIVEGIASYIKVVPRFDMGFRFGFLW